MLSCDICNSQTEILTNQTYHYLECGLDNVYLEGIETRVCKSCGASIPRIPRIAHLHNTIALAIALKDNPLTAKEVRFLRKRLNLKLNQWAKLLRVANTTLSKWENGEREIGSQSDLLIRLLYLQIFQERESKLIEDSISNKLGFIKETPTISKLIISPKSSFSYRFAA